jgi:hypothetical protein
MTKQRHISIHVDTAASPAAVFRLLADGSTWTTWSPIESFELEQQGDPPPEGVGATSCSKWSRTDAWRTRRCRDSPCVTTWARST